jgi:hypothetical protein
LHSFARLKRILNRNGANGPSPSDSTERKEETTMKHPSTMKHLRLIASVIGVPILLALAACGGGGGGGGNGGADPWTTLISRSWSVTAGTERYECRRIQIPADMYITGFRAIAPPGQHKMTLTVADSSALPVGTKTGDFPCSAGEGMFNMMIYASGIGTDDVLFPDKVGVHLKAGQFINLNMHLVNANNNSELNGISGVMVKTGTPADVTTEADMFFAGTFSIFVTSNNQTQIASGGCIAEVDMQVFALWSNMRSLATHQKMTVTHAGVPQVVFDTAYDFNQQRVFYPTTPLTISRLDQIQITCSYVNNTGSTLTFGDSSTKETCFTGVYRYPTTSPSTALMCVN